MGLGSYRSSSFADVFNLDIVKMERTAILRVVEGATVKAPCETVN